MKHHDLFFTDEEVLLSDSTKVRMIAYKDIVFFVTDRPYVIIGTEKKERIYVQISMSRIAKCLPSCFCMCSQSVIINLSYVNAYENDQHTFRIYLRNGCIINASRRYHNILKTQIVAFKKMMMNRT